jgi:RHS repeat-associated protein
VNEADITAFGQAMAGTYRVFATDIADYRFLYRGYWYDKHLGIYHVRHRAYDPTIQRWLQPDPAMFIDGMNVYAYCGNEPFAMYDPMGLYRSWVGNVLSAVGMNDAADYVDNMADAVAYAKDTWNESSAAQLYDYSQDREAGQDVKDALDVAERYVPGADRITQPLKGLVDLYQGNGSGAVDVAIGLASGKDPSRLRSATDIASGVIKNPPNQYGRKGGPLHQEMVDRLRKEIEGRGNAVRLEHRVKTPGGKKENRYVDLAEYKNGEPIKYYQVGKQNKDGTPVKRERDAIEDIDGSTGGSVPVEFYPYNTCPARPSTGAGS